MFRPLSGLMARHCSSCMGPTLFTNSTKCKVGSVFALSSRELEIFTQQRLLPGHDRPSALWGCSSRTGFLAPGENLIKRCLADKKVLADRGLTFHDVANRLSQLVITAIIEMQKHPQITPLLEKKFFVTFSKDEGSQYCPFSLVSDAHAGPDRPVVGACAEGRNEVTIINRETLRRITFNSLLPHLIECHHFFEGNVPHRLDPKEVIETLQMKAGEDYTFRPPKH